MFICCSSLFRNGHCANTSSQCTKKFRGTNCTKNITLIYIPSSKFQQHKYTYNKLPLSQTQLIPKVCQKNHNVLVPSTFEIEEVNCICCYMHLNLYVNLFNLLVWIQICNSNLTTAATESTTNTTTTRTITANTNVTRRQQCQELYLTNT